MPYVTCPTCGERGKIPSSLIGQRIKCRKCGLGFQVSPPAAKPVGAGAAAPAAAGTPGAAAATTPVGPSAAVEMHGIEVEGLDASSWALPTETAMVLKEAERQAEAAPEAAPAFAPASAMPAGAREYKLLTSRDKIFEGRFELPRLEEALNQCARQGWVAKAMTTPHLKGFSGALEEVIVVLLERCKEGPA
jgi:hypothetical protein